MFFNPKLESSVSHNAAECSAENDCQAESETDRNDLESSFSHNAAECNAEQECQAVSETAGNDS